VVGPYSGFGRERAGDVTRSPLNMLKKGVTRLAGWLPPTFQSHNLLGGKGY